MIRIVNLRNYKLNVDEVLIRVDRKTVVGNPFYMASETQRDLVCNQYQEYFDKKIKSDENFLSALRDIYKIAKVHDIALGCWCYPKRCHAETIKTYIESFLQFIKLSYRLYGENSLLWLYLKGEQQ